jgi:predicted phage tail protein
MRDSLVKVNFHGNLASEVGGKEWEVFVTSFPEAMHAINIMSENKLRKYFLQPSNLRSRYKVLVNDKEIPFSNNLELNELNLEREDMSTIEIIPVLAGAGDDSWVDWLGIGLGIIGLGFATSPMSAMAMMSLISAGISNLLAEPPDRPATEQITLEPDQLANSYLFQGPVNVVNEGSPVPMGYGRMLVGSTVIMSTYDITYADVDDVETRDIIKTVN